MAKKKKKSSVESGGKVVSVNKKARRDYEIINTIEAGLVLNGAEVKSVRAAAVNLKESYVRFKKGECYLVGCHISPYAYARQEEVSPTRERKLLLHRREIIRLEVQVKQKGLTVVPLKLYFNAKGRCKIELGLGRGKKLHDKRQDVKEREAKRQLQRIK